MTNPPNHAVDDGSPDRFGYSWERFNRPTPDQDVQFRRWTVHLDPAIDWLGRRFLDAGCGAGRNSYWAMTYGAAGGLAVDIDERSLGAARANLARFPTVEVRFQSIYDLEESEAFDIVFSIGVIHHLSDPDLAIRHLVQAAKKGGRVLIWVYGYENMEFYVKVLNPLRVILLSRLPVGLVRWLAYPPAALLWVLLRLGIFNITYFRLLRQFSFRHLHHIVFDQMLPKVANYWTREEARDLFVRAGLADIRVQWVNEMSWSVIGTRPE
jgi:SAM-dependent methyltransferase